MPESASPGRSDIQGHDVSGPTIDEAMTRSEERMHVGTERVETDRARLRKYIVTENVQTTVPVSREEVRVERAPITDANRGQAMSSPELSEEEHEVTLTAERSVVGKETVPVERVRRGKETTTEERQVSDQVRKRRDRDRRPDRQRALVALLAAARRAGRLSIHFRLSESREINPGIAPGLERPAQAVTPPSPLEGRGGAGRRRKGGSFSGRNRI
jgi:uncharacterized protein (TIGR02271 family)